LARPHSTAQHNTAQLSDALVRFVWCCSTDLNCSQRPRRTPGCDVGMAARGRDWVLMDPSNCKASDRCRWREWHGEKKQNWLIRAQFHQSACSNVCFSCDLATIGCRFPPHEPTAGQPWGWSRCPRAALRPESGPDKALFRWQPVMAAVQANQNEQNFKHKPREQLVPTRPSPWFRKFFGMETRLGRPGSGLTLRVPC
jgi:hypothetical protein